MVIEQPNYYAIIPANVRYDNRLKPNAKLLYGEITALCNKQGFCWAGNSYFANLYGMGERNIQNLLKNLQDCGYVEIKLDQKEKNPRKIYLPDLTKKISNLTKKITPPHEKNFVSSIYSINNTINTAGKAVFYLIENYPTRFESEFLRAYEKQFNNQEQFTRFLMDFNDEADIKQRTYGVWLMGFVTKYARNWLDSKKRFEVIRNPIQQPTALDKIKVS